MFFNEDNKLKVSPSLCPSVSPSLDQHPVPPERSVQPPVPPLHRGHPVHRREPGALQPQTHSEPSPETAALPGSVYKQLSGKTLRIRAELTVAMSVRGPLMQKMFLRRIMKFWLWWGEKEQEG